MTTPEAPTAFDEAIKKIGAPDESNGHWSLDEGNLRWFVSQCQQVQTPTPENVDEAIDQLLNDALCHRDGYGNHHENAKAIRAHIAAQDKQMEKANHDAIAEVKLLCKLITESRAEVERLRVALNTCEGRILNAQIGINTGDTKAGLSKYLDAVLSIIRKALNPEQKGGV